MKQGKSLERLVEYLERILIDKDVIISSPYLIADRLTGEPREFDVVLQIKNGHHESLIAIECRDRSRKVTVNEVESFWKKCEDTGVRDRIIVSSKGFYKTALKKAAYEKIRCLELQKVESASKNSKIRMGNETHSVNKRVLDIKGEWIAEKNIDPANKDYTIVNPNGLFTNETLHQMIQDQWREFTRESSDLEGVKSTTFVFDVSHLHLIDCETNEIIRLREFIATVEYEVTRKAELVDFFDYVDLITGNVITNFAVVENYNLGNTPCKMIAINTDENTLTFSFIPKNK